MASGLVTASVTSATTHESDVGHQHRRRDDVPRRVANRRAGAGGKGGPGSLGGAPRTQQISPSRWCFALHRFDCSRPSRKPCRASHGVCDDCGKHESPAPGRRLPALAAAPQTNERPAPSDRGHRRRSRPYRLVLLTKASVSDTHCNLLGLGQPKKPPRSCCPPPPVQAPRTMSSIITLPR